MQALPEAKVDQYDSVDLIYQALNSGRADAAATDQSSAKWLIVTTPGKYMDAGYGWNPQTYSCAVKRGDQDWLNFVNTALHEAMTGVEFGTYSASFKKWFGVDLPPPADWLPGRVSVSTGACDRAHGKGRRPWATHLNFGAVWRDFDLLLSGLAFGPRSGDRRASSSDAGSAWRRPSP